MLTRRETDTLILVAQGYSDTKIAEKMRCDTDTIRHYLFSIRRKLGYPKYTRKDIGSMRVHLAMHAVKTGLYIPKLEQVRLPNRAHVIMVQHKFVLEDKVCVTNKEHKLYKEHGIITSLMPYTFKYPAYDVEFGDRKIAMSESSLEKV